MDLTAHDAAAALRDLEAVEETLTARTAGLTSMVWGLASPLILLTYAGAIDVVEAHGLRWLYALLWLPGTLLGVLLTHNLWHQHALRMRWSDDGTRLRTLAYAASALVGGVLLWLLTDRTLGWDWSVSSVMVASNGLLAVLVTLVETRDGVPAARSGHVAGAWMVLAGVLLGATGTSEALDALLGAAATALGWTGAGLWMLRRG